jgi:phenylalanyl-tRNA synthetase alpha chain
MADDINKDNLLERISNIVNEHTEGLKQATDIPTLNILEVKILGRKSELTKILKQIKDLKDPQEKKLVGQQSNFAKQGLERHIKERRDVLKSEYLSNVESKEKIDVTIPGNKMETGHIHPVTQMTQLCEDIFMRMGFDVQYPYAIDDDYHNFEALNMPKNHPARDSWDTFWTEDDQIAITHTSSMQNRILTSNQPPIRVIVPGRCFRNESTDTRHEHTFSQIEGVYVDKGINLTHMLGVLREFFSKFYEKEIDVKFTPDFFPFVEPGGMMSLSCVLCNGKGCSVCKNTGWLEILGCGMIHPKVLEMANIDPNTYSGFAWGFGVERLIMLKYDINDIRYFYSGNLDFLKQF